MTAAALPNIFPGSPQIAGQKTALTGHPAGSATFEDFLAKSAMAPSEPVNASAKGQEKASPLEELFKLINLLWGETGKENVGDIKETSGTPTGESGKADINDNGNRWNGLSENGFISDLEIMMSMFQKIASSFESADETANTGTAPEQGAPILPNETGSVTAGAQPGKTVFNTTDSPVVKAPVVAPGINLSQKPLTRQGKQTAHDRTDMPGKSPATVIDPRQATSHEEQPVYGKAGTPGERQTNDTIIKTTPKPEITTVPSPGRQDNLDLHLLTFSYTRQKGMDITDVEYKGPAGNGLELAHDMGLGDAKVDASVANLSREGEATPSIEMAKATVKGKKGSSISIKKIHVPSAFSGQDENFNGPSTGGDRTEDVKNGSGLGTPLTIDFNSNKDTDAKRHSAQTQPASSSHPHHATLQNARGQDAVSVGHGLAADQAKGGQPQQPSLGQLVTAQIRDGINQALKMNRNKAVLHLNPPELGSVKVSISVSHNNHVQASFVADHPETRHILEANMQHLRDSLAQNGFAVSHVNVDVGGGFSHWSGNEQEKLTPFGLPSMWLNKPADTSTQEPAPAQTAGVGPYGVHVIA